MYSLKNKLLFTLLLAIVFFIIASPFMFRLTNKFTNIFNWQTSTKGCPNISGLLLHTIVFALIVILLICIITNKEKFNGLIQNPGTMLDVVNLRIEADQKGCNVDKVIQEAQNDPFNREKAIKAVETCKKDCPGLNPTGLAALSNIPGFVNHFDEC
jgi:predicted PurR-regulated permease PerM